jgi:hypothetical protein
MLIAEYTGEQFSGRQGQETIVRPFITGKG